MTARSPARLLRREQIGRAFQSAVSSAGVTYEQLAVLTDAVAQHLHDASRATGTRSLAAHDLAAMPASVKRAVCEAIMGPGWIVAEIPTHETVSDHLTLLHETHAAGAELVSGGLDAVRDGTVTAAEGTTLAHAAKRLLRLASTWLHTGTTAQRERVIGVSRGGR